jgi:hypothetical protein
MMHFVTVATKSSLYFPFLLESCAKNEIDLQVLGWGGQYTSHMYKIYSIMNYIDALPDTDVVCYFDAYDVIVARNKREIEEKYMQISTSTERGFIVSRDIDNDNIVQTLVNFFLFPKCFETRMNMGTFVARVQDLKVVLGALCSEFAGCTTNANDQEEFVRLCRKNKEFFQKYIAVDVTKEIFMVFGGGGVKSVDVQKFAEQDKKSGPCIVHCPGICDMFPLIEHLGYSVDPHEKSRILIEIGQARFQRRRTVYMVVAAIVMMTAIVLAILRSRS